MTRARAPRLEGFDYRRAGAYFVTFGTWRGSRLLGRIAAGEVSLGSAGEHVRAAWLALPTYYTHVELDAFVVMPDHVHGVIMLSDSLPLERAAPLTEIVANLKSYAARAINVERRTPGAPVWHRGFHERIVRDSQELDRVRRYIAENPMRWWERYGRG
jgi:putative transposase